jgi:3-hydroxyisobutyrate dehydrogenase-like beta-hydroxyacid dehydrogenase
MVTLFRRVGEGLSLRWGAARGKTPAAVLRLVEEKMRVGFIGLGMMGKGMAANLQKAGHDLVVHDLSRAAAEPFLAKGAVWANSPKEVAAQTEVVFTSLPVPADVESVALGANGLIQGMRPDTAFFDMSTNSVAMVRKIHAVFAEKNLYMLDSPVSGGPSGAASGKMAIWVGGDEQIFNRHKPVLDAMGDQAAYIGPIGAGSIAKLVHNCTSAVLGVALAEVFTMGIKAGVDPVDLWAAVRQGATGRVRTFDRLGDKFLQGKHDPADFALRLLHKDVGLAVGLGREVGVPMRLANMAYEELTEAMNRGWSTRNSTVGQLLQVERAGIPPLAADPQRIAAVLEADKPK